MNCVAPKILSSPFPSKPEGIFFRRPLSPIQN
jgi:hypothetical protein